MRKIRILNLQFKWFFSVNKFKKLTFQLPLWADDTHVNKDDGNYRIKYYKGCKPFYIDLPKCKHVDEISITPRTYKKDGDRLLSTHREIVVEIFY